MYNCGGVIVLLFLVYVINLNFLIVFIGGVSSLGGGFDWYCKEYEFNIFFLLFFVVVN